MSTTYTPNIKLGQPALGDAGWSTPLNANCTTLDSLAPVGALAVTPTELPSASLNVAVAAGNYVKQDGTITTYAGTASQAITASSTKYLYLDLTASGALTVGASFPATAHVRLAVVVAGGSTLTSVTDARLAFEACGSVLDGTEWTVGSTNGLQIGTAGTQKLGFFGATPVVQPADTTDLRTALINLGLYASGGALPLNLNGGALTVGSATVADGGNVVLGSSTGTKIGTATTQKLGFFNATPVVQQTMGAATASSSYTSVEQGMLQAVYNAVRRWAWGADPCRPARRIRTRLSAGSSSGISRSSSRYTPISAACRFVPSARRPPQEDDQIFRSPVRPGRRLRGRVVHRPRDRYLAGRAGLGNALVHRPGRGDALRAIHSTL